MAARYFINGGTNNNWGSTTNWATTSGGAGGASVPTAADDAIFDASSPDCTIDTSARVALTLVCTNYTKTLTFTQQLSVSGNITLGTEMMFDGASPLIVVAASTITTNGKSIDVPLWLNGITATLASNITATAGLRMIHDTSTGTLNGFNLFLSGELYLNSTSGILSGTTIIILNGTSTVSMRNTAGGITIPITINTSGNITFSGNIRYYTGTLTYTAGTVDTTGSTLIILANVTLNTSGMTWNNVSYGGGSGTITLTSNLILSGIFSSITTGNLAIATSDIVCGGSISLTSTGNISGRTITLNGTGTVSTTSTGRIQSSLTINTSGTITFSGTVRFDIGTLTYTAGTIITTGSLLVLAGSTTLATSGITWNDIHFNNATCTLNSVLAIAGTMSCFNGGNTLTINNFSINLSGNLNGPNQSGSTTGTATIIFTGTGTWSQVGNGRVGNTIIFNTSGNITVSGSVVCGSLTYTAGTIITTNSYVTIGPTSTLNVNGIIWNIVAFTGGTGVIYTFSSNMICSGTVVLANGTTGPTFNGSEIRCNSLSGNQGTGSVSGTTTFRLIGTGTITGYANGQLLNNLILDTNGGTTTFVGIFAFRGTFTITSSTNVTAGSGSLRINGASTLDCNGAILRGLQFVSASNYNVTLNSNMGIGDVLSSLSTSSSNAPTLRSNVGGTRRKITFTSSASFSTPFVNVTDIDSSDGAPGFTINGTITNSLNWYQAFPLRTYTGIKNITIGGGLL